MDKLDLNELSLDVGGKITVYIDWREERRIVKPSVRLSNTTFTYNIGDTAQRDIQVGYASDNATDVRLQLRKIKRTSQARAGSFDLGKGVFSEGVGQYIGYVIPSNPGYGDGEKVRFNVNVVSKSYLPGPDIINIQYPSLVKGADFRGTNVNFSIGYESVNTNYVNISVGSPDIFYGKFSKEQKVDNNIR